MNGEFPVLTANRFAQIIGAQVVTMPHPEADIDGVLIDTRNPGSARNHVFFAINGLNHDGHAHLDAAVKKGCTTLVVEQLNYQIEGVNCLQVSSSQLALQSLGAYCRQQFTGKVAAICGSNGKTTVKDWAWELLTDSFPIYKSPGSFNSQIGVPLSLWYLSNQYDAALIEAGISLPGEMERLEKIVQPDFVVYTHIGDAHGANFPDEISKLSEKGVMTRSASQVLLNGNQPEIHSGLLKQANPNAEFLTYGVSCKADFSIHVDEDGQVIWEVKDESYLLSFFSGESEDLENLSAALAVAVCMGGSPRDLAEAVPGLRSVEMRMEIREGAFQRTLINDVWSNDISSLRRALQQLWHFRERGPLYLVYTPYAFPDREGNMIPAELLGEVLGDWLTGLWGVGELFAPLREHFPEKVNCFNSVEELIPHTRNLPHGAVVLIKGARSYRMERVLRSLEAYTHSAQLHINLHAAGQNLRFYRSRYSPTMRWMVLLKAAGYGAGEVELAQAMQSAGVDYLAVATADEGVRLRRAGIQLPILVLNPSAGQFEELKEFNLEPGLYSLTLLRVWLSGSSSASLPFHVKLNTGMNRLGIDSPDWREVLSLLNPLPKGQLRSVYSHFAASDDSEADEFSRLQLSRLNEFVARYKSETGNTVLTHISNSGAIQRGWVGDCTMVRLGIGLYGISVRPEDRPFLKEVLSLTTSILQIRDLPRGAQIGYGVAQKLDKDARIGILALGYADGYKRNLGFGKGKILVHGKLCPTVGAVSMDLLAVDLTLVPEAREGDTALVFGADYSIQNMAIQAETIPYEIMTGLGRRLPRIFTRE